MPSTRWNAAPRRAGPRNCATLGRSNRKADEASLALLAQSMEILRHAVVLTTRFPCDFRTGRVSFSIKIAEILIFFSPS